MGTHLSFQVALGGQEIQDKSLGDSGVHFNLEDLTLPFDASLTDDNREERFTPSSNILCSKEHSKMYLALSNEYSVLIWTWGQEGTVNFGLHSDPYLLNDDNHFLRSHTSATNRLCVEMTQI